MLTIPTRQWSEAARSPRDVAAVAETAGWVRLERRGEVPFILVREDRLEESQEGLEATARLLGLLLERVSVDTAAALIEKVFAWTRFLSTEGRADFAREYVETFAACNDVQVWAPLGQVIREWKATAAVAADPELAAALRKPIDTDFGPVPAPEGLRAEEG
jgi:hypothetical protein